MICLVVGRRDGMSRIKVIDNYSGRKGTIDEKDFDESRFTMDYGTLANFANKGGFSKIFSTAGGLIGGGAPYFIAGPAGALASPGMAFAGASTGRAAGTVVDENIKRIAGAPTREAKEYVENAIPEAGGTGAGAASIATLFQILYSLSPLLSPSKAGGAIREKKIAGLPQKSTTNPKTGMPGPSQNVSSEAFFQKLRETDPSFYNKNVLKNYKELTGQMTNRLYPMTGTTNNPSEGVWGGPLSVPNKVNLSDFYKTVQLMESRNKPYNSEADRAAAAKLLSRTLRQLGNETGGKAIQGINKKMAAGYNLQDLIKTLFSKFKYAGAGAAGSSAVYGVKNATGL